MLHVNTSLWKMLDSSCIYIDIPAILMQEEIDSKMQHRTCLRHGAEYPCTCAMGNLYRFVEPVVLYLLKKKGRSYGYELAAELREHALTDASIEAAALYTTLRPI